MVTGHSMGGAMASFCGLDLIVITIRPFLISLKVYFSCYTSMHDFLSVNIIALLLSLLSLLASSFQWPLNNMVYCVRFLLNYCYGYGKNTQELMCTDVDVVAWCVYNSVTIFSLIYTFQAVKSKNAHCALNFTFSGICLQVAYLAYYMEILNDWDSFISCYWAFCFWAIKTISNVLIIKVWVVYVIFHYWFLVDDNSWIIMSGVSEFSLLTILSLFWMSVILFMYYVCYN